MFLNSHILFRFDHVLQCCEVSSLNIPPLLLTLEYDRGEQTQMTCVLTVVFFIRGLWTGETYLSNHKPSGSFNSSQHQAIKNVQHALGFNGRKCAVFTFTLISPLKRTVAELEPAMANVNSYNLLDNKTERRKKSHKKTEMSHSKVYSHKAW